MYETPITSELVKYQTIDSHIWQPGVVQPYIPELFPSIMDFANDGLKMAIYISLFSDRRFLFSDGVSPVPDDRRGWWGDTLLTDPGDLDGSGLWLLEREKIIEPDILTQASDYITEALQWLLDDGVVDNIDVFVERAGTYEIGMAITVSRPENFESTRYYFTWNNLENTVQLSSETAVAPSLSSRVISAAPAGQSIPQLAIASDAVILNDMLEAENDGLKMAVYISMFTDRRFGDENGAPPVKDDRRGWWGDSLLAGSGDSDGSQLWTLDREKILIPDTLNAAQGYIDEALEWMIEDGVATEIDIFVERRDLYTLGFQITIHRPGDFKDTKYYFAWNNLENTIKEIEV